MHFVVLYTKVGCGLCDIVKDDLAVLQADYPHQLREIDITADRALFAAFMHKIPVVRIGEIELQAPISRQDLAGALAASG